MSVITEAPQETWRDKLGKAQALFAEAGWTQVPSEASVFVVFRAFCLWLLFRFRSIFE